MGRFHKWQCCLEHFHFLTNITKKPKNMQLKGPVIMIYFMSWWASLVAQMVKNLPAMQETGVWSLGQEDPLEKEMVTHSSVLAWRILWTEKPGRLQSMGSQRVRHDWATNTRHPCSTKGVIDITRKLLEKGSPAGQLFTVSVFPIANWIIFMEFLITVVF